MHPRPKADTRGPRSPSLRSFMTPPNSGAVAWMQYDVTGVHVTRRGPALVSFSKGTLFRRGIYGALRPPGRPFGRSTPLSRRSRTRAADPDQDTPHRPG